jgi:hypothetical protein
MRAAVTPPLEDLALSAQHVQKHFFFLAARHRVRQQRAHGSELGAKLAAHPERQRLG